MTRRDKLLVILLLCAAAISPASYAARADLGKQIVVDAKRQSIDIEKGVVLFEGDVVVRQGTLEIHADQLRIEQSRGKGKEVLIARGHPVVLRQTLDDGRPLEASADEVRYELDSRSLTLNGSAKLKQQDSSVSGETMRYNLLEGRLLAESGSATGNSRVTAIFTPQQLEELRDGSASEPPPSKEQAEEPASTEQPQP